MDPQFQRRVQRYGWDLAVPSYETGWRAQLEPAQTLMLEMLALQPGERALDVACGTGLVSLRMAEAVGPQGAVVGTDISGRMVEAASEIAAARGFANLCFERADAEELPFADASFDAAACALGLMYVPDPIKALAEMCRTLKPGGRAAAAVWGARANCGWAEIFPITAARVTSEVCPLFFQLGNADALADAFRFAGFEQVESHRLDVVLRYDSAADAIGAAFAGGPVAMAYSRFDPPTRDEAHEEYLASIAAYRRGDAYEIPGEYVVAVASR